MSPTPRGVEEVEGKKNLVETYPDIEMTVEYFYESHWVDFKAYEIVAEESNAPLYEAKEAKSSEEMVREIADAQTYIRGAVKWDGCSHVYFGDDNGYIHLCGKLHIRKITQTLEKIYNRAGELMERKDVDEFPLLPNQGNKEPLSSK
jgi:hypothetical protein